MKNIKFFLKRLVLFALIFFLFILLIYLIVSYCPILIEHNFLSKVLFILGLVLFYLIICFGDLNGFSLYTKNSKDES
jgi:preprotein translocase subunit SecG